jgi:hypothetical protein
MTEKPSTCMAEEGYRTICGMDTTAIKVDNRGEPAIP